LLTGGFDSQECDRVLQPLLRGCADAVFSSGKPRAFRLSLVKTIPCEAKATQLYTNWRLN
jgi:hypothetical protein